VEHADLCPRTVARRAQARPGVGRQAKHPTDDRANGPAVGDRDHEPGGWLCSHEWCQHRDCSVGDLRVGFAAAAPDILPARPGGVLVREQRRSLLGSAARPGAQVDLAQSRLDGERQPGQLGDAAGGIDGTDQVRRHQSRRLHRGDGGSNHSGLLAARVVEWFVPLALEAADEVVGGLTVPQHEQTLARLAHAPGAAAPARSSANSRSRSTNGTVGQSFHSRSRE